MNAEVLANRHINLNVEWLLWFHSACCCCCSCDCCAAAALAKTGSFAVRSHLIMIFSSSSRRRSPCQTKDLSHKLYDILREKKRAEKISEGMSSMKQIDLFTCHSCCPLCIPLSLPLCRPATPTRSSYLCAFSFFPVLLFTFFSQYRFDSLAALPHTHLCYLPLARFAFVHNSQKILIFAHCTSLVFFSLFCSSVYSNCRAHRAVEPLAFLVRVSIYSVDFCRSFFSDIIIYYLAESLIIMKTFYLLSVN